MAIALRSRTEVVMGVWVGEMYEVYTGTTATSLLEFCDEKLALQGFTTAQISHLGVVDISASFTSTRLLTILANMLASFGTTKVALLPSDFFEQSSDSQRILFEQASFSDSLILGYNGMPNITTPKH